MIEQIQSLTKVLEHVRSSPVVTDQFTIKEDLENILRLVEKEQKIYNLRQWIQIESLEYGKPTKQMLSKLLRSLDHEIILNLPELQDLNLIIKLAVLEFHIPWFYSENFLQKVYQLDSVKKYSTWLTEMKYQNNG